MAAASRLLAVAGALLSAPASAQPILGVPEGEWASYRKGGDTFACADASATIPLAQLNDDYCDCADGSDEPGTSACASHGGRFFCLNRGFRSAYLRASVVNDGVCDCCDGSDEHASGAGCANNCVEVGASARAEAQARVVSVSAGHQTASKWGEEASATKATWESELAQLQAQVDERKKAADAIEEEKKVAEEKESVLREEYLKKKAIEDAARKAEEDAKRAEEEALRGNETSSGDDGVCRMWRQAGGCKGDGEREPDHDSPCETMIEAGRSGYCECAAGLVAGRSDCGHDPFTCESKCQEAVSDAADAAAAADGGAEGAPVEEAVAAEEAVPTYDETAVPEHADEAAEAVPAEEDAESMAAAAAEAAGMGEDGEGEAYREEEEAYAHEAEAYREEEDDIDEPPPDGDDHHSYEHKDDGADGFTPDPEAEALREKHRKASDEVRDLEGQVRDLESKIGRDYGPNMRFEPLSRECVEFKPGGEFSYELCPFVDAKQKDKNGSPTTVGKWEGFGEGHATMRFTNGQHCWNAGARELTVILTCAEANKILGVEEPEVCKYAMRFETPAACTEEHVAEAKRDAEALIVHDEL